MPSERSKAMRPCPFTQHPQRCVWPHSGQLGRLGLLGIRDDHAGVISGIRLAISA